MTRTVFKKQKGQNLAGKHKPEYDTSEQKKEKHEQ